MTDRDRARRARALLARTEEQLRAAQRCLDSQLWSASAASAIRAGKSAADAIAMALDGRTVTDTEALTAAEALEPILRGDHDGAHAVIALQTLAHSESTVCRGPEPVGEVGARGLVSHAQALIDVARRVV